MGETIERNNEIRYFAIDDRLYPLGGAYYADQSYHRGQTTGIFYAPTTCFVVRVFMHLGVSCIDFAISMFDCLEFLD